MMIPAEARELQEFADRLNGVLDKMGVPPKGEGRHVAVSRIFSVSVAAARKWVEGEGYPKKSKLMEIARKGGTTTEYLLTGQGEAPSGASYTPSIDRALFEEVMESVLTTAEQQGKTLSHIRSARLVCEFYEQALKDGRVDRELIARVIRLTE